MPSTLNDGGNVRGALLPAAEVMVEVGSLKALGEKGKTIVWFLKKSIFGMGSN